MSQTLRFERAARKPHPWVDDSADRRALRPCGLALAVMCSPRAKQNELLQEALATPGCALQHVFRLRVPLTGPSNAKAGACA